MKDPLASAVVLATIEINYSAVTGAALLDEIFAEGDNLVPADGNIIKPGRRLLDKVTQALGHTATISRCLHGQGRNNASKRERELHSQRAAILSQKLEGLDLRAIQNREVRNSIEHLEEHIERFFARRGDGKKGIMPYNMTISRRAMFADEVVFCRVYICDERRFENLTTSVELEPVRDALRQIADRLRHVQTADGAWLMQLS